jgi:hypothetical protein
MGVQTGAGAGAARPVCAWDGVADLEKPDHPRWSQTRWFIGWRDGSRRLWCATLTWRGARSSSDG